jgi:hypothetical protein
MLLVSVLSAALWPRCITCIRKKRKERLPIPEPILRPPGHGLRLQIEKLDDELSFWILSFLSAPMFELAVILATSKSPPLWAIVPPLIGTIGLSLWKINGKVREVRSYRLGLVGELFVASQLDELREQGYKIHDFALPNQGNIDHIAVVLTVFSRSKRRLGERRKAMVRGENRM